jgi:hypothetical protein
MSVLSYLAWSWALIRMVLVGSLGLTPTTLVSSVGRKVLDEVGSLELGALSITIRRSYWSSTELASSKFSWLQV